MRAYNRVLFVIPVLCLAVPVFAQRRTPVIWHDRGDAAALDRSGGPGGTEEPGSVFRFIEESRSGTSPKFEVEDEHGIRWKVKLGEEAQSETAATRLLWAAGYLVDAAYYRPQMRVEGLPKLDRGQEFVSNGNTVTGARLERQSDATPSTTWSWYDNPFIGTRQFNGLRVMMALINNWDLKEINNGATDTAGGGGQYAITDVGATLGRTGNSLTRSKGVIEDYADTRFIDKVTPTHVDFRIHSRPFFLSIFNFRNYRFRTRMESVARNVPIADARWLGERLGQLSAEQIGDCFRAAGFSATEVEAYSRVVTDRIAALKRLGDAASAQLQPATDTAVTKCLQSTCRQVPLRETLTAIPLKTTYASALVGGFEQGAGIGGGVQLSSAHAIPGVEFRAAALSSTKRYRRFDLQAFLPNIGGSRNHGDVWVSHLERETDFFGIGPRTPDEPATQFAIVQRSYQGSLYRDFAAHLQSGVYTQIMNTRSSRGTDPAVIPMDEHFSSTPGEAAASWLPGFDSNPRILSYGGFVAYDSRDNSVGLTRGLNLFGRIASADGVGDQQAARYAWMEKEFDARGHAPLGSPKTSLSMRARGQFKTPKSGGSQIPFYNLSWLGGRQYLRGYESYRFRGNNVLLLSTELQQTMYSMTPVRGIDAFAFAETGQVWGDARSSTDREVLDNQAFNSRNWHSGLGGGLQYRHSRSIAARVEVGRGKESSLIYASLSRGF